MRFKSHLSTRCSTFDQPKKSIHINALKDCFKSIAICVTFSKRVCFNPLTLCKTKVFWLEK
jgi:hypothetical protein